MARDLDALPQVEKLEAIFNDSPLTDLETGPTILDLAERRYLYDAPAE